MAHIKQIDVTSNNNTSSYLIEPTLFSTATVNGTGTAYTASFNGNFELISGVCVQVKFPVTNADSATLNNKAIFYNNIAINANTLKANHTYALVYDGVQWQLIGDIDTNTTYNNGAGLNLNGTTFSVIYGTTANTAVEGNDSRLSDARPPTSHTHGNITDDGKIGTGNALLKTSNGEIQAGPALSAIINNQDVTTRFLREDGSWSAPSYPPGTDIKVTQNGTLENKNFPILLKHTNNYIDETDEVNFVVNTNNTAVTINPFNGTITAPGGFLGTASSANSVNWTNVEGATNLQEIESLIGTGLLRKTGSDSWEFDSNTYVTSSGITSITINTDSPLIGGENTANNAALEAGAFSTTIGFATQNKNLVLASDETTNGQVPTFRALTNSDLPLISIANGGTEITSYSIGDILYASASDALSRLPGNTTSIRQFLYSSSNGNIASQPGWDILSSNDIPELPWSKITSGLPTTLSGYGIVDAKIENKTIILGLNSLTIPTTLADLGITKPLQFRGGTTTQMSDGYMGIPDIGISGYTPDIGDVVLDSNGDAEYVCISTNNNVYTWELLGRDGSWAVSNHTHGNLSNDGKIGTGNNLIQTSNGALEAGPTLSTTIVSQDQTTKFLREDGTWAIPSYTINAANVTGIISIANGGTGVDGTGAGNLNEAFGKNEVIITNSPVSGPVSKFITRAYANSSTAEAIGISDHFVTEQDIYHGLPNINNLHTYTSQSNFYAPTSAGSSAHNILVSTAGEPEWTETAKLSCNTSDEANTPADTILTLGNNVNITAAAAHSEGKLYLYSSATMGHILKGDATTTDYSHILRNTSGYLVQTSSTAQIGSSSQPVYVNANGIISAITYTPSRLYYSATENSFMPTDHYATRTNLFINKIPTANENITDTLYVNGTARYLNTIFFSDSTNRDQDLYYIDNGGNASVQKIYIGGIPASSYTFTPYLYVNNDALFNNNVYFNNSNNYINSSGQAQLTQINVGDIQLDSNGINFIFNSASVTISATSSTMDFAFTNSNVTGFRFNSHILPSANSKNLGASDLKWQNVYATTFYGALEGNATTATQWATAQQVYADLTTDSTSTTLRGGEANETAIGIHGTLAVSNGGTGVNNFTPNEVIMSGSTSTAALITRSISNSSVHSTIGTSENLVTEQDVYYGLPQINNSHNYDQATTIYAPTTGGTANQILISNGSTNIPTWSTYLGINQGGTGRTTITRYGLAVGDVDSFAFISTNSTAGVPLVSGGSSANPTWNAGVTFTGSAAASYIAAFKGTTASSSKTSGAVTIAGGLGVAQYIYADRVYNAVWNDYAEFRESAESKPGICVQENDNGCLTITNKRLIPGACIITDTYGYAEGQTSTAKTPIAVAGRVLAYTYQSRNKYHAGMAVCSAPNGTIDIMTRKEIKNHPDAIIGIVSEIPNYDTWGSGNIKIDNRIWIKVK